MEIMRKFSEQYARRSGTYFCVEKGVTSVVIKVSVSFRLFIFFISTSVTVKRNEMIGELLEIKEARKW